MWCRVLNISGCTAGWVAVCSMNYCMMLLDCCFFFYDGTFGLMEDWTVYRWTDGLLDYWTIGRAAG